MSLPSRKSLLLWLSGVVSAAVILGLGALVVVEGGFYDVAASTPDPPAEVVAVHTAMIRSVQTRAVAIKAPPRFTPVQIEAGLRDYDASCAICHGGPGVAQSAFAHGMTPSPPYIVDAARHWRARELYWIVAHGVKMTAMPSWESIRTDAQIWNIVAFLEAAPYLTPREYARIRGAPPADRFPAIASDARGT
jgi:mono/diheme cytochrome c family protein